MLRYGRQSAVGRGDDAFVRLLDGRSARMSFLEGRAKSLQADRCCKNPREWVVLCGCSHALPCLASHRPLRIAHCPLLFHPCPWRHSAPLAISGNRAILRLSSVQSPVTITSHQWQPPYSMWTAFVDWQGIFFSGTISGADTKIPPCSMSPSRASLDRIFLSS